MPILKMIRKNLTPSRRILIWLLPTRGVISIEYFKKARGLLVAESRSVPPKVTETMDYEVFADIRDAEGDMVARVTANWRLSPIESKNE